MAVCLLSYDVSDLCLGKPPLRPLSAASATVVDALSTLKSYGDCHVSVWACDHSSPKKNCICIGKICMVDIICYLCETENLSSPAKALKAPVTVLISKVSNLVRHVEPSSSLLEAIELILKGTQNLVIPIKTTNQRRKPPKSTSHNGREYCWLAQEDIIRFLLNSIGLFNPIATLSIESLGLISSEYESITYHSPALAALPAISCQMPIAVLDSDGISLMGEISPITLSQSGEATAAAVATLSAENLMAYINCCGPHEDLVRVVEARLRERKITGFFENFVISDTSSSSEDDDSGSQTGTVVKSRYGKSNSYSTRRGEAIVCHRESSLVAVMIRAVAHRVNYVWVVEEEDCSLVGIVTFSSMLEVFYEHLQAMVQ